MSRIIQQIATVQFQVDNRKVTASMNALQTEAESLNGKIAAVNQNIKNLGDVPPDNKFLLEYQKQLRQLNSDLKDVTTAQRDLMKGVKAADQLWKAAATQDIESLSIKAIKAGQNGLRKRMENLRPELGGDEQKMYDAYKAVIGEADRVMNVFKSNYATVVQTIRDGGIVSEQVMKSTRDALRDLMEAEKEGTAEHRQLAQQYDFLNESLANVAEMRRREKGEIVNANDARREALKLTEDGIAAARRERDMADTVIAGMQQQKSDLDQLRRFHEDRIAQTEREIATNQRLEEAEQDRLADAEKAMRYVENEDRKEASRLRKKADAARDEAEAKKEAYEQQAEQEKLLRQHVKDTGDEVTALTAKIEALGKTEAKPKVDTSALDAMKQEIADIESQLNEMGGMHTADMKAFNERLWHKQDKMKEVGAQNYKSLTTDPDADYFNFGNKAKKIIKSFAAGGDDRRHDLMYSLSERGGYLEKLKELESEHRAIVKQRTEYLRAMDETGKKDWEEAVRQLDELDSAYSTVISILKDYKQQFDKIKPADDAHMEKYEQLAERRATLLEKMASAEQQSTTATNDQTEAIDAEIKKIQEQRRAIEERREEIAKEQKERDAAYEKEKKRLMGNPAELNEAERKMFAVEQEYTQLGASFKRKKTDFNPEHLSKFESRFGVWEDFFGSGRRSFAKGMEEDELNAYKNQLYDRVQGGNLDQVKEDYETIKRLIKEINAASKDSSIEGNPNLQLDALKKLKAEYEKVVKAIGDLGERKDDAFFEWLDAEASDAYKRLEDLKKIPDEVRKEMDELDAKDDELTQKYRDARERRREAEKQQATATKESTQADQQSVDVAKQKAELEDQRTEATKRHTKAQKDYEAQQEKTNKAQEKAYKAQEESVALNEKAATAEEKVAHQEEEHAKAMDQQSERLRQIRAEGQRLLDQYEQQKTEIQAVDKAWADADVKQGEAEARKAQNQELTIKSLDDSIRKLKEANAVIDTNSDEWEENTRIIRKLQQAQDEISQKQKEMMGEWMSYAEAQKMADSVGTSGFVATDVQIKQATEALNRHRESLIKTIQERERDGQATAEERSQLTQLDAQLAKLKTGFGSADEVMQRFNGHLNAGKTASEGMASALDEKLSQATSSYDVDIELATESLKFYEEQVKKDKEAIADLEEYIKGTEKRLKSWNPLQQISNKVNHTEEHLARAKSFLEGNGTNYGWRNNLKDDEEQVAYYKEEIELLKQKRDEELRQAQQAEQTEEKKQDAQRLTQEQMQEGIKLLEEEYRKTDHTTAEGIKRRELLRQTIDQMNQEIKESTGEWMSLAQAEELASKAGTSGFFATGQQMQQATQAIERQRDALTKTIQQKQRDGEATKKEEEELQRLEKVLKDLKFEQDNFNMSHKQMEDLLKHPKKAEDLDQLKAAIKRADGELHRMKQSLGDNNDQYRKFAAEVKAAKNELKLMEGQAKATTGQLEKAWSRLKTYVGLYMGFNMAWQKFTGTIGDMKELSDRMGEVGKTTQMAAGEIARMTTNLSKMDTRTALTSLVELSAKAGQLGLKSREDVEGFTEAANKMLVALPEMGADGATQMMKVALATGEVSRIQKQMDEGLMEGSSATAVAMEKIASTIDQLRANSAAAAPQITDFVKRVGAVGAQSGISIDQVAALGSTVDALGMRVEMSATALSRMIPAIKNNAFDVAKAIGMAPEALRKMFDEAGGGMNAMLAIFQHIKDQGMNANDIEKMLGMGGMQEIMKELNQQGARAGIVFAGLSQNVDVLREHLNIAGKAYEENIAIQQEYDRMNETTAAKWERLGNQIEEMFVGPGTQSVLGDIADGLRVIVDLVSGPLNTAFWATSAAVLSIKSGLTSLPEAGGKVLDYLRESAYKAGEALREAAEKGEEMSKTANGVEQAADAVSDIGDALDEAQEAGEQAGEAVGAASGAITNMGGAARVSIFSINGLKMAWKGLDTTMKANIIVAVIALLWTLGKALYDAMKATDAERDAVAKANQEADRAVEKLDNYFARLKETKEELDKVTKSTEDATDAEIKMTKAKENHRAAILNINKNYGQYLGFMLTEYDRAELVAAAHDKITAAIRREMLMKAKQAAIEDTGKEYEEGLTKDWSAFSEELVSGKRLSSEQAAEAKLALRKFLPKSFTVGSDGKTLVASNELKKSLGGLYNENASLNELTAVWFARHLQQNYGLGREAIKDITGIDYYKSDYGTTKGRYVWTKSRGWSNLRGDYLDEYFEMQQKNAKTGNLYNDDINAETKNIEEQSSTLVNELKTNVQAQIALLKTGNLTTKETEDAYGELARSLEGINENVSGLTAAEQRTTEDTIKKILEQNKAVIDSKRLQKARENIQKSFDAFNTFDTGDNEKNPWGSNQPAESTDWKNMTAEQLVNRRKQMKDFVNAIQTDTDVQSVLKEDAALKKAIENGMSSDMRTVIEWYNTERLKIQDELHARHLTNTGDWMDPKKEKGANKQFRDEMDAYLHELDAYYTERKTRIEEAGTDEGLTEAEIRNRTLNNEMEWQQRRAELQKLYSRKQKEVTQEELDAIYHIIAERTGDSESFVKAQIAKTNQFVDSIEKSGEKGAAIVHRWMSQVELDTERSYLKGQQALTKQMRAIEAIIDKERPFNGITKSLQESLSTMDILTGEMRKEYNELMKQGKSTADFNARQHQEEMKRTAFLLGEAENAYSTTIDRVMDDMRQKGMTAWAGWLSADPKLQEALMAQLRSTYDAIQDAIKKEASQLKKQAEIMWNNILMPDGKTTLKQQTDRVIAQLGLDEGRVKRANSLIGAGQASERVADKLAIQQMKIQLAMQEHYYNLMKKQGQAHVDMLKAQAKAAKERGDEEEATRKTLDAQHAQMSLNLATSKEETELAKQREDIIARTEESQNRLYTELKSWADLLSSSLQGVMEASHAGDAEYYNERAKLDLTGKGGPGAGTYVVIDNSGTEDARAHYEYLDERQALERQREIENQNAVAEAWKKMWDDLNQKMSDTITDQINAMLQNASIDANTDATLANTQALVGLTGAISNTGTPLPGTQTSDAATESTPSVVFQDPANAGLVWDQQASAAESSAERQVAAIDKVKTALDSQFHKQTDDAANTNKKMTASTQSAFAKMTQAANLYGIAYQTVSNDNLSSAQKFQLFAVQAAGNAAIAMLTTNLATTEGEAATALPGILGKAASQLGPIAGPIAFAAMSALLGGLMGLAVSKIAKSKSTIAQVTGASVGAGRLSTGMLTYAEGNVNEFTDPATLTPGRSYNVDAADGRTYRARYMGKNPRTHLTHGPEFHLVGEAGQEAIIDAKTTRLIRMDEVGIWKHIQTLYNGGSLSPVRRRGSQRGVRAFAEGNLDEFEDTMSGNSVAAYGTGGLGFDPVAMQTSLDRNSEVQEALLRRLEKPITVSPYGPDGIVAAYDKYKKEAKRYGVNHM